MQVSSVPKPSTSGKVSTNKKTPRDMDTDTDKDQDKGKEKKVCICMYVFYVIFP